MLRSWRIRGEAERYANLASAQPKYFYQSVICRLLQMPTHELLPSYFNCNRSSFMEQLPAVKQAYFTQQVAGLKSAVLGVWVSGVLIAIIESFRIHDLGFDPLRMVVYLPMSVLLLTAGVVMPVLNYRRYKRLARQYSFNAAEQHWTLTPLYDEHRQIVVRESPTDGHFTYFGKEYPAKIFTQQQVWYFPL